MKPFSEIYIADGAAPGDDVDVVKDIYVPALQNSNLHKRLTYSFTSQGLVELAEGLEVFIKNNGVIQLIVGSPISEQEERSIKIAEKQSKKDDTFKKLCMIRLDNLFKSINEDSEIVDSHVPKRLYLLTQLIAAEKLKIKPSAISNWKKLNKIPNNKREAVLKLSTHLDLDIDNFLTV